MNPVVRAVLELATGPSVPAAQHVRTGFGRFLPRTDVILRAPVVVAVGAGAEACVREAVQHWLPLVGVGPSPVARPPGQPAVVPTQFVHAFGLERASVPHLLMRLSAPLFKIIDECEHEGQFPGPASILSERSTSFAEARRRFAVCATAYGCEQASTSAADLEELFHNLDHATRCTHDTGAAFRDLADACVALLRRELGLREDPTLAVWIEGTDVCGPAWVGQIARAARVLAHERVVFVVDWPTPRVVERSCCDAAFIVVDTP